MNAVLSFIGKHRSQIAFGAGLVLTGTSTVLAVKATPGATDDIRAKEKELGRKLSGWEKFKLCWKRYLLPAGTEVLGVACLIAGHNVDLSNTAAAMAAVEVKDRFIKQYEKAIVEEIGEERNADIKKEVVKEQAKSFAKGSEDCSLMEGDCWYLDPFFGKRFISSDVKMQAAVNQVNEQFNLGEDVTLNDFFSYICDSTPVTINKELFCDAGEMLGFESSGGLLEITYETQDIWVGGVKTIARVPLYGYRNRTGIRYPDLLMLER